MTFEELSHYLRLGGATLAIILAASVLSIGVAVERWIALWNMSANSRALTDAVGRHLLRGDVSAARGTVERSDTLLSDVYRVGFERLERSRTVTPGVEAAVERERAQLGLRGGGGGCYGAAAARFGRVSGRGGQSARPRIRRVSRSP